ncbi:MAG: hypothetical protein ACLGIN_13730 [Candidatus Sericytochromatia bacterium]
MSRVLSIFGYLVTGFAVLGLICLTLIAVVPDMRGKQTEAFQALARLCGHGLAIGVIAIVLGLFARSLPMP